MTEVEYESRHGASRADDIEEFVPGSATPFIAEGEDGYTGGSNIYTVDDGPSYHTGVHCTACYCSVATIEGGVAYCPNCGAVGGGERRTPSELGWEARAAQIERFGVSERRAEVVALVEADRTHQDVVDELDLSSRGQVYNHLKRYREGDRPDSRWLQAFGPEV